MVQCYDEQGSVQKQFTVLGFMTSLQWKHLKYFGELGLSSVSSPYPTDVSRLFLLMDLPWERGNLGAKHRAQAMRAG